MKKTLLAAVSLLLVAALFVGGCKKTDNPTNSNSQPTIPVFTWSVPGLDVSDTTGCSTTAWASVVAVQAMTQLTNGFAALPGTNNNGTWTWNIPNDGVTYTLTGATNSDGGYTWSLKATGTDTQTSITYTNFTVFEGTTSADGTTGTLTVYDQEMPTTPTVAGVFSWSTSGTTVNATFEAYDSGNKYQKIDIVSTTNGGGSVTIYMWTGSAYGATPVFHGTWSAPDGAVTCG
jgi:hypothetical protein